MPPARCHRVAPDALPALRFEIDEAAQILRMSRGQLYHRIQDGSIRPQKDGARTYITRAELERYVLSCAGASPGPPHNDFTQECSHRRGPARSPQRT
jgi:excisionase family DNA binding protein